MGFSLTVPVICILQFCSLTTTALKLSFSHSITNQLVIPANPHLPCRFMDFNTERFVCKLTSEEDEHNLCQEGHCCSLRSSLCPDGSLDKICYPVGNATYLHYGCVCHSTAVQTITDEPVTTWSEWTVNDNLSNEFNHSRHLYLIDSGEVLLSEFANRYINHSYRYIVSGYNLPNNVYNASSTRDGLTGPERARIDKYLYQVCMWTGLMEDSIPPYLQINLPTEYHVVGIYIAQRCDIQWGLHYATMIDVTASADGGTWEEVLGREDISTRYSSYDGQGSVSVWYNRVYIMRYWRLYILKASKAQYGAKCDLIGYL